MRRLHLNSNLFSGIFLLVFSLFFILITPSQVPLYEASDALSPRLFPYTVLSLLGLFGVILIIQSLTNKTKVENEESPIEKNEKVSSNHILEGKSLRDLLLFIGICAFIILLAESIGFTFASIIGLVVALNLFGVKPWYKTLIAGILIPLAVEFLYRFLGIYLPLGFWEDIIYSTIILF